MNHAGRQVIIIQLEKLIIKLRGKPLWWVKARCFVAEIFKRPCAENKYFLEKLF
jgi:hypothetical protein